MPLLEVSCAIKPSSDHTLPSEELQEFKVPLPPFPPITHNLPSKTIAVCLERADHMDHDVEACVQEDALSLVEYHTSLSKLPL